MRAGDCRADAAEQLERLRRHRPGAGVLQPPQAKAELPAVMVEQQQAALLEIHFFAALVRRLPLCVVQQPADHLPERRLPEIDGLSRCRHGQIVAAEQG